jgi:thymidylate kinase
MRPFRAIFDGENEATRTAYYRIGNHVAGVQLKEALAGGKCVVIDRYYASTMAYVYGKRGPLPEAGSAEYAWPEGLPRPQHQVLLTLPEEARLARRAGRTGEAETAEEGLLRSQPDIAARINEAYVRFGCAKLGLAPEWDAEGVAEGILRVLGLA